MTSLSPDKASAANLKAVGDSVAPTDMYLAEMYVFPTDLSVWVSALGTSIDVKLSSVNKPLYEAVEKAKKDILQWSPIWGGPYAPR